MQLVSPAFSGDQALAGKRRNLRATRLESLVLADEIFQKGNLYDASLLPAHFANFADLGSNVGYFTCWLAHLARGRKLRGLIPSLRAVLCNR